MKYDHVNTINSLVVIKGNPVNVLVTGNYISVKTGLYNATGKLSFKN